ncbi:ATP-binding protein [Niabella sp. CC-SYL272]|uniref:ATP-dependent nuclease n=1 Tax=Niabella agricola TaxID=2891571 RepID=UPI001F33CC1B|nr:AAA family ATPase [Niabella agricola]MCF3109635.1 ATP-binding protein [Niabella agricola]
MKLTRFTIKNFRSFKDPVSFSINSNYITLTGENNCGKSNVLRALDLFFNGNIENRPFDAILDMHAFNVNENGKEKATISVTFQLDPKKDKKLIAKFEEFRSLDIIKNFDNKNVTLSLTISRSNYEQVQYNDPINGQKYQPKEIQDFFNYDFRRSLNYIYIPAVKDLNNFINKDITYELTKRIFNTWGRGRNPSALEFKSKFDNIKKNIEEIISSANGNITQILQEQSPQIKNFIFNIPFKDVTEFLSSLPISIDDSIVTDISRKGSGIQAITMFSLLRYLDKYKPTNKNSNAQYIWAIEEPETFLHPKAQRNLYNALLNYSSDTPILLTTHSYHFLNTRDTSSNNLLAKGKFRDTVYTQTTLYPHDSNNQWKPFINILGAYTPDFIPSGGYDKVYLFLEGSIDIRYVNKALTFFPKLKDFFSKNIEMIDSNGDEIKKKAQDAITIYKLRSLVLVDGDDKGRNYLGHLIKAGYIENETIFSITKEGISDPTMETIVAKGKEREFQKTMPKDAINYWNRPRLLTLFDNIPDSPPPGWDKNSIKIKFCTYMENHGEISDFQELKTILDRLHSSALKLKSSQ